MTARKLNDQHEVWYVDETPDLAELLVKAGLAVSKINGEGRPVNVVNINSHWSDSEGAEYWSATIVVDGGSIIV